MTTALLASTYFGPIQWYQKLLRYEQCLIDADERWVKQSWRNRCDIATATGKQSLSIPVVHATAQPLREIRISDHGNWQRTHWHALEAAYGESAFFEYYADDLRPFFERPYTWLIDLNTETTAKICELLEIETPQIAREPASCDDFRRVISPKHPLPDAQFQSQPYYQVFAQKTGFLPNLSILDLLMNCGNESVKWLKT